MKEPHKLDPDTLLEVRQAFKEAQEASSYQGGGTTEQHFGAWLEKHLEPEPRTDWQCPFCAMGYGPHTPSHEGKP